MLYQRYSNPIDLLQQMFQAGRLSGFVEELGKIILQEKIDKRRWEFWLHRVHNMDFDEYVNACEQQSTTDKKPETIDENEIETIVKRSNAILERFKPK